MYTFFSIYIDIYNPKFVGDDHSALIGSFYQTFIYWRPCTQLASGTASDLGLWSPEQKSVSKRKARNRYLFGMCRGFSSRFLSSEVHGTRNNIIFQMVVSVGWWTKPLLGKWLEITTSSIHLNSWLFGVLGWCVLHLKVFCNPDSKIWFWLFAAMWEIETHWGHFSRAVAWKTCLVDNGNRSFSGGGWWNLSCSPARYRESLVNRMVISEPCIVCLAATTLSAKINSWPRLILWKHLLLVQWSEFRKSDLPNKYKIPARSIRKICCKMNLIFPSWSGLQHYAMAILHGHFSWTWPCFSKKEAEPCLNSKNGSLTLVKWLIVPLDARWRFTITESFLKGAH